MFLVIGLISWTWIARTIRGQVLVLKTREFIASSQAIGCSDVRIMVRHLLPNVLPLVIVLGSLATANTVLLDAGLSYLGVGVPPPTPSWGTHDRGRTALLHRFSTPYHRTRGVNHRGPWWDSTCWARDCKRCWILM